MSEEKKEKNSSAEKNENLNTLTYEELAEKVETLKEESLRSRAELENFKKRSSIELSNALKFANTEILSSLIPIVTSLEKALENSEEKEKIDRQGILLILNSFEKILENFNIVPINPSGEEFDPELHEAVSTVNEKGVKDNIVKSTLERGWKLNDRVVKPALVIVNKI
jgi:molecular chaperone GrpE|tara:strand:+ start:10734 stop:11237 length:504 start_codon:yes stop_codon:yes gene_type:complete